MPRLSPTDLLGSRVLWLLDLTYAGMVLRLSDAECDVLDEDGKSYHYFGALNIISVEEGVDFLSDASGSPSSAAIDVVLPVDVPSLVAAGHDLAGGYGVLYRWVEGTPKERARAVVAGVVKDPEHGTKDEPVSFSLESAPWDDPELVPHPSLILTGTNLEDDWILTLPAESLGLAYPVVIGRPGKVSTTISSTGRITGSQAIPAWLAPINRGGTIQSDVMWIVAGHHCVGRRVYQNSDNFTSPVRAWTFNGYDRAGHPVCYIPWWAPTSADTPPYPYEWDTLGSYQEFVSPDTDGATTYCAGSLTGPVAGMPPDDANDDLRENPPPGIYISWDDDIDGGGGLAKDDGTTMREAGDVVEWLLGASGAPVDRGRFAAAKPLLSRFRFDFTIDEQVTPWDFLSSNILPLLPVSLVTGPDGVYPIVWRYEAKAKDAICHLDTAVDPYLERASNVSFDTGKLTNKFTLNYALSVRVGEFQASLTFDANGDDGAETNHYCTLSQRRYKRHDGSPLVVPKSIDALAVYDDATAHAILAVQARAYCFARKRVEYVGPEATYGWLERGAVVTLTDASIGWDNVVALIESITTDGSPMLRLKLLVVGP